MTREIIRRSTRERTEPSRYAPYDFRNDEKPQKKKIRDMTLAEREAAASKEMRDFEDTENWKDHQLSNMLMICNKYRVLKVFFIASKIKKTCIFRTFIFFKVFYFFLPTT